MTENLPPVGTSSRLSQVAAFFKTIAKPIRIFFQYFWKAQHSTSESPPIKNATGTPPLPKQKTAQKVKKTAVQTLRAPPKATTSTAPLTEGASDKVASPEETESQEAQLPLDVTQTYVEDLFEATEAPPLDATHLVTGAIGDSPTEQYREWFVSQACIREAMVKVANRETREQLALIMLQASGKGAPHKRDRAEKLHLQTSPFFEFSGRPEEQDVAYFRDFSTPLLSAVYNAYKEALGLPGEYCTTLVNGPLAQEVLARQCPDVGEDLKVDSLQKFESIVDALLEKEATNRLPRKALFYIDCSALVEKREQTSAAMCEMIENLERIIKDKIAKSGHPSKLLEMIVPFGVTPCRGQLVLINKNAALAQAIRQQLAESGCVLSQDGARRAWLAVEADPEVLLKQEGVPIASLATGGESIPVVCQDFSQFVSAPIVAQFSNLAKGLPGGFHGEERLVAESVVAPYVQIHAQAILPLLKGLEQCNVDKIFAQKGLSDLLQISYFRMLNAMREANLRKDDLLGFFNQIELIHQEIQAILAVVQPYDTNEFADCMVERLTSTDNPLIPRELGIVPQVYVKTSGMNAIMSALSAVEQQKGSNRLNVCLLKDCYFEATTALDNTLAYDITTLDGDRFNQQNLEATFSKPPNRPMDVFVAEFHHNFSLTRKTYRPERVCEQILAMQTQGLMAEPCTVILDTSMDLEQSTDVQNLLENPAIQELLKTGKLNIVLARSAQKFDMLGMDNYSGGIVVTVNNGTAFENFNARMAHKDDQLGGLSYQGLTHLQKQAGPLIETYRTAIMANTQYLYQRLPADSLYTEGSRNAIQIMQLEDPRLVYLHIAARNCFDTLWKKILDVGDFLHWPITCRDSWGFTTSNLTGVGSAIRLSVGLEDEKTLDQYAHFFTVIQNTIRTVQAQGGSAEQIKKAIAAIPLSEFETEPYQ